MDKVTYMVARSPIFYILNKGIPNQKFSVYDIINNFLIFWNLFSVIT